MEAMCVKRAWKSMAAALMLTLAAGSAANAKVVVTFWCQFGDIYGQGVRKVAEAFNKSRKDIEVRVVTIGEANIGQEKLMSAMAAGSPPDCSTLADLLVAEYAAKKLLYPVDSFMKSAGWSQKNFWKPAWNVTFYEGKQWAVPFTEDCRALYYNSTVFRDNGMDPNRPPKNLEDLEIAISKLFKYDGSKYTKTAYIPWGGNWWFYGWGWLFGGEFYDAKARKVTPNDPKNIEALEWLVKYAQRYDMSKLNKAPQDFTRGTLAMVNDGNWYVGLLKKHAPKGFDYNVTPVPPPSGRDLSTWSGVWTIIIPRSAKHPKQAWEFIKFASGPEGQAIYAKMTSQTPANIQATRSLVDDLVGEFGPQVKPFIDLMDYSHHRPTIPVGSFLWDQLDLAMWNSLRGKKSPRASLDECTSLVSKELTKVLERTKGRK